MAMFQRFISYAERTEISLSSFMLGFAGIMLVRFFLESISSPAVSGIFSIDAPTLLHYTLFYLSVFLAVVLVVGHFVRNIGLTGKIFFISLPILWLSPIVDLVISKGHGILMAYIFASPKQLVSDFFLFFGPKFSGGITAGIRVEVFLMLVFIFYYVYKTRGGFIRSCLVAISAYAIIFFFCSLPSILYAVASFSPAILSEGIDMFWSSILSHSLLISNSLNENFSYASAASLVGISFDKAISQILVPISFILFIIWFYLVDKKKTITILKNSRPERIAHYLLLIVAGIVIAMRATTSIFYDWIDLFGLVCLCVSVISAWICAVCVNDVEDIQIDVISNPQRPLPKGDLGKASMQSTAATFFIISLLAAWAVGYYQLFAIFVFSAVYYLYSVSPYRLKRIPIISSFLISLICLVTVFDGFFFIYPHKSFEAFPPLLAIGVVIIYTLAANIRDLKDIAGDSRAGIKTVPVIFGPIKGFRVVGGMFALAFLLFPHFFSIPVMYYFAVPFSLIGYYLINRKPYDERYIFILGITYTVIALIFLARS
jgi:4-hydroxybenzoate polyprenyltransferase